MYTCLPLNLTGFVNDGRAHRPPEPKAYLTWRPQIAASLRELPGGRLTFRGISFDLPAWTEDGPASILLRDEPVTVRVDAPATQLVFAHFCDAKREPTTLGELADLPDREKYADIRAVFEQAQAHLQARL